MKIIIEIILKVSIGMSMLILLSDLWYINLGFVTLWATLWLIHDNLITKKYKKDNESLTKQYNNLAHYYDQLKDRFSDLTKVNNKNLSLTLDLMKDKLELRQELIQAQSLKEILIKLTTTKNENRTNNRVSKTKARKNK